MNSTAFRLNNGGASSGANIVRALAGNTFLGATVPQPIVFGDGNNSYYWIQSVGAPFTSRNVGTATQQQLCFTFQIDANQIVLVDKIRFWNAIVGSPTAGTLRGSIQTTSGGNPTGTILGSGIAPNSSGSYQDAVFSSPIELTPGIYAVVFDRTDALDNANCWSIGCSNYGGVNQAPFLFDGAVWNISDLQPDTQLGMTYALDTIYLAAQGSGNRMNSIIANSGSGNQYTDAVPPILKTAMGWVVDSGSIGDSLRAAISGAVSGFTALVYGKYHVASSDGTIASGAGGNEVGRAILSDTIRIIPQ